jgi:hypothetical protein
MDNIDVSKLISNVNLVTATSAKTGKPYSYLELNLVNGESIQIYTLERGYITVLKTLAKLPTK